MTGHYSFADMKTENALFALSAFGVMAVLLYAYQDLPWKGAREERRDLRWLLIAGMLLAAGFATKVTMVIMVLMAGIIMSAGLLGWAGGIGATLISIAILQKNVSFINQIVSRLGMNDLSWLGSIIILILIGVGVCFLIFPLIKGAVTKSAKKSVVQFSIYGIAVAVFLGGFFLHASPWMIRNTILNGKIGMHVLLNAPDTLTPQVVYKGEELPKGAPETSRELPEELAINPNHEACVRTERKEELDRYWGYRTGVMHFIGLPWRMVMNKDSQGYYLTLSPLLLLMPLLLFFPGFWRSRPLKILFGGTLFYLAVWIPVASGIPWYGIGMFLGFAVIIEAVVLTHQIPPVRILAGLLSIIAIATAFSFRMWQFEMQRNLYEFAWGKASYRVLEEVTIPHYDNIAARVLELHENPDRPFLYRAGTFIPYFIPKNSEIMVWNDNQLGNFNCLNQEKNHKLTLKRLQALGFNSIIFDTNTATIERDPNGTLHQKVNSFLEFANDASLGLEMVINNPGGGVAYMVLPKAEPDVVSPLWDGEKVILPENVEGDETGTGDQAADEVDDIEVESGTGGEVNQESGTGA